MKAATIHTLRALVSDLKVDALHAGRYPPPCNAELWEQRDKSRAFRCIAYKTNVRRINAIEDAISTLESLAGKGMSRENVQTTGGKDEHKDDTMVNPKDQQAIGRPGTGGSF